MTRKWHAASLAFALCIITTAVNLQAPLYAAYAREGGYGVAATTVAFSCYVVGILPVLLMLGGLSDRIGRRLIILVAIALSMAATTIMILSPHLSSLGLARMLLGVGTALMSATAPSYMSELFQSTDTRMTANWVTASTSLGFGLGAALTSLSLLIQNSMRPLSFWLFLILAAVAFILVWKLPDNSPRDRSTAMLRFPYYPKGSLPFGCAIMLSWATVGLVIAILPSVLTIHHLETWSGFSTFTVISCGLLFQPLARKMKSVQSTRLGLFILSIAYVILAWGALKGSLAAVLLGALAASSACYGFVYLGGLSGVAVLAGSQKARTSAGFFLLAYVGFSLPVITTGLMIDHYGRSIAFTILGVLLVIGAALTSWRLNTKRIEES